MTADDPEQKRLRQRLRPRKMDARHTLAFFMNGFTCIT
jgi:hypothetical protein